MMRSLPFRARAISTGITPAATTAPTAIAASTTANSAAPPPNERNTSTGASALSTGSDSCATSEKTVFSRRRRMARSARTPSTASRARLATDIRRGGAGLP